MNARLTLALLCAAALSGALAQTAPTTPARTAPTPVPAPAPATTSAVPVTRPPAANYVIVGNVYYEQGKFDQAYVAFRAATELDPRNTAALLGLGRSQVKLRLYAPAIETLRQLVQADPQGISGYIALSQAYQQQFGGSGDRAAVAGNLTAALGVLQSAEGVVTVQGGENRDLNLSKVLNERGNVYRLQGDGARAIEAFRQASALNPDNSLILFNLGDMYFATGNLPQAISSLQQAVITDPRDPYNRAYYAKLLALSGNAAAARPEAAQAARLAPTNAYAVGQYGVVSFLAKDGATARTQLTRAVTLDPLRYPEFYYYLGRLSLDGGDLRAARENLTKAVALDSTAPEYAYYLGVSYERGAAAAAPDNLKARENYERALKLNPGYRAAQDALGRLK
ncbi:tetratricopeptide repeat protein [Deinococcus petrolearius]|uniref:Tetratricopeptide repeat protein n=1 Tax=Deinococcus petrolearius TaxID=1751295 RepID=A0ABW1DGQ0_9DEIO